MLRISVFSSKELQATILALKGMDREISKQLRQQTKKVALPEWQKAVAENSSNRLESRVLVQTARVAVSNQNVTLSSATIGRSLAGGFKPSELAHSAEFGSDNAFRRPQYQSTSVKGKKFTVRNRHTRAQFRPRNRKGYVIYPAAADIIPRLASLWVQTVVRGFYELIEGR